MNPTAEKKIPAGILAILLGSFGVHKFYLGYTNAGIIMLACSLFGYVSICFLMGIPVVVMSVIGLVEGIIYLTKSDQEFVDTYVIGKKEWF